MAEHEMTTRATTAKIIHIDFIRRDFEVNAIAQIRGNPGAEYHETVAQPNGSDWNTVSESGLREVPQTNCRPITKIPEEKQDEDEEGRWKWKVEVALSACFNLRSSCH